MHLTSAEDSLLPFPDRESAAILLAEKIKNEIDKKTLLLAIPRGGVVTGKWLFKKLGLEMDLMLCKKVGHPFNPEYAIGSVCSDGSAVQTNHSSDSYSDYFKRESNKLAGWLQTRYQDLTKRQQPISVRGREILLCDDGVATGSTMMAAVRSLRNQGAKKISIATPVISVSALTELSKVSDGLYYLCAPHPFGAVGEFYVSFPTVTDDEVRQLLTT